MMLRRKLPEDESESEGLVSLASKRSLQDCVAMVGRSSSRRWQSTGSKTRVHISDSRPRGASASFRALPPGILATVFSFFFSSGPGFIAYKRDKIAQSKLLRTSLCLDRRTQKEGSQSPKENAATLQRVAVDEPNSSLDFLDVCNRVRRDDLCS